MSIAYSLDACLFVEFLWVFVLWSLHVCFSFVGFELYVRWVVVALWFPFYFLRTSVGFSSDVHWFTVGLFDVILFAFDGRWISIGVSLDVPLLVDVLWFVV